MRKPAPDTAAITLLAGLRKLPVFAELEAVYGPGHDTHLDGTPLTLHGGTTRMCWAWFPGGDNHNFTVDYGGDGHWAWLIRARSAAGHAEWQQLKADPAPTDAVLRGVAITAGLLPGLAGAEKMVTAVLDVLAPVTAGAPGAGIPDVRVPVIRVMHDGVPVVPSEEGMRALAEAVVTRIRTAL